MIQPHILKLPTPRLLAFYKKHYRGPNPYTDWWGGIPDESNEAYYEWEAEQEALKKELDSREHVEN